MAASEKFDEPSAERSISNVNERALVRKIDLRLLPMLFVVYLAAFLDRVNISNALTMGLQKDLKLKADQPNIALTIFFVPYVVFEVPSNILLKRLSPHVWLSFCTMLFGVAMIGQAFVKNFSGILATRFFLGLAEAGIFPGSFYLLSFWYKREESQKRFAVFWCSVLTAGAFGGLLASAIAKLDGTHGLKNWRWIFILEGTATCVVAIIAFFTISDFPESAKWLTEDERELVKERAGHDHTPTPIGFKDVVWFFKSPMRVIGALMYWGIVVPIYCYSYFAPTIIKTFGYTLIKTQLRSVIPFAAALGLVLIVAWASDYTRLRYPFVMLGCILCIAGLGTLMTVHHNLPVQFGAICLVAMGAFTSGIVMICWYVMNLHGHVERSIGTAWLISFGNTGGIVATFAFLAKDAPLYHTGYSICMAAVVIGAASATAYAALVFRARRNKGATDRTYTL